jgi:UDP:flavonoid glycosyltransferase YjiC (YdhE family)
MEGPERQLLMVFPLDMAAHYLRCLELCKKLQEQFRIVVAHSAKYEQLIHTAGFETFTAENFDSAEIARSASRFDFAWLNVPDIKRVLLSQTAAIEAHQPSVVLGDAAFTLKMAAEHAAVPFVSLLNGYLTKYCRVTRRVSPSHPAYAYSKTMPKRAFERVTRMMERLMFEKIHAPFRTVRRQLKLPKRGYFLDELEGDLNLICDLPSFFPQKKLPPNYDFIGPLFYNGCESEQEARDFLGRNHPAMLVTTGSTGTWKNLSLLRDPLFDDCRIVVSGNGSDTISGDNIYSKPFLNHMGIMDKIDIVVCHGGNGTMYQALSHGVPLLCLPSNFEQEWNIQQLTEMGLGARLDTCDASCIRKAVDTWIEKRTTSPFSDVRKSIKSFVEKPVFLNPDR